MNSLPSKESQRGYRQATDEFITWCCSESGLSFNKAVATRYRIHWESRQLAPSTIDGRLTAVGRLAYEAADSGLLPPDLAAGIRRIEKDTKLTTGHAPKSPPPKTGSAFEASHKDPPIQNEALKRISAHLPPPRMLELNRK